MSEPRRFRPYTGNLPYAAGLVQSAASFVSTDVGPTARRMWTEDDARDAMVGSIRIIREAIARMERDIAEIEAAMTTVEEEQAAAKENADAA